MNHPEITRQTIQSFYGRIAETDPAHSRTANPSPSCCNPRHSPRDDESVPQGADLGLGCGNPHGIASIRSGETVLDLGSGAGYDCFLAARAAGSNGHVIGVDMTPEMVHKARRHAEAAGIANVSFRLGEIENLPVADRSVDVILSNCVINLSVNKPSVFRDAWRVLKPGGRMILADIIATADLPEDVRKDPGMICGCIGGAAKADDLRQMLAKAGFEEIEIRTGAANPFSSPDSVGTSRIDDQVASAIIMARKPEA